MVKKSKTESNVAVDSFRTISFDNWLRLFMQVRAVSHFWDTQT